MSEIDKIAPGGIVQLNDAPGSLDDEAFDSMFPAEPPQLQQPVQQVSKPVGTTTTSQTPTAPAQPAQPEYFLKGDKTVYKTVDDAVKGINHKDATIDQLRQRYALATGIDPITGQPVGQGQQGQSKQIDYTQQPDKYLEDLAKAAQEGKPNEYAAVQGKYIDDKLAAYRPVMAQLAKSQALESASKDNPEVGKFIGTETYNKVLQFNPDLANAIATAEVDPNFHTRLPGLYKLAHLAGQGLQLPDLLKAQNTVQPQTTTPQSAPRPTAQSQPLPPSSTSGPRATLGNLQGIRAIIAEAESKGLKLDF